MATPVLKIFSYLPNPRVWKAQIAGALCGVEVEVVGTKGGELNEWLWDFAARPLEASERTPDSPHARTGKRGFSGITLYKTDAFLEAHPFGTVPAAFSPDGGIGIFESNSILRAVARAGTQGSLYGDDPYTASRIDSFLDAGLVFAREAQVYLLGLSDPDPATHARMAAAYEFYLVGIEAALQRSPYLAGEALSIADISFVCDLAQFLREGRAEAALDKAGLQVISKDSPRVYPRAIEHMLQLSELPEFAPYLERYLGWYRKLLR